MVFEFKLPDVGEGVAEGEIVEWHVEPGDQVTEDQVLAEVETDKAVVDLPSPKNGTIKELHAEPGDIVPVGDVVVTIEVEGEGEDEVEGEDAAGEADAEPAAEGDAEQATEAVEAPETDRRVFAPPNVRRLAREVGVDISSVEGSGPSGRITEEDVRQAAQTEAEDEEEPQTAGRKSAVKKRGETPEESVSAEDADRDRTLAAPATRKTAEDLGIDINAVPTEKMQDGQPFVEIEDLQAYAETQQAAQKADAAAPVAVDQQEQVTREPYRGIRRTIGKQMAESAYTAPHVTHHDVAQVESLVEARADLKERAAAKGVKLTYMPFVMKAIVAGLEEYPMLNSELDEDAGEIIYKHFYNIGIAVATDAGLMVPVVKNVQDKGLLQLASEVNELVEKARNREISTEEMRGGTFTITNFGAIGGEYATPIINYPETAILGLGGIDQRPVVEDGEVVARNTMPLSLSIDHRVIDGAEAAQFTNTVIEYLQNPTMLLL